MSQARGIEIELTRRDSICVLCCKQVVVWVGALASCGRRQTQIFARLCVRMKGGRRERGLSHVVRGCVDGFLSWWLVVGRTVPKGRSGARWTARFSGWSKLPLASRHCRDLLRGTKEWVRSRCRHHWTAAGCERPDTGHDLWYVMSYVQPSAEITEIKLDQVWCCIPRVCGEVPKTKGRRVLGH